jgi:hypothetical protein
MERSEAKVGMLCSFGRYDYDQTPCRIEKCNSVKCKVITTERRGKHPAGSHWNVPYSMLNKLDENGKTIMPAPKAKEPMTYNVFMQHEDKLMMEAILTIYGHLSPENLTCDGEASRGHIRMKSMELNRKLKYLTAALGYEVSEEDAYAWYQSRQEYEKVHSQ